MPPDPILHRAGSLADGRVLVTGADGFIGSHLTEALVRGGCKVRAFVFYNSFNSWGWLDHADPAVRDAIEVVAGDIRDAHAVRAAMRDCDVVFHLAALISIPFSYIAPQSFVDTNVTGTLNVLQAARDLGTRRVVHTSTSEVYGTARYVPIDEAHPLQGQSPYSATKIAADQMALAFHRSFDTPVTILRPFNTYGPRQSARAVIPTVLSQVLSGRRTIRIGSLHPTRDFNFVSDTVAAFIASAVADAAIGEVVHAASNFEVSIGELVTLIGEVTQCDIAVESDDARIRPSNSEVERLWGDNARARDLIGWSPAFGGRDGLRRGLAQTVAWLRRPENLRFYKPDLYNV